MLENLSLSFHCLQSPADISAVIRQAYSKWLTDCYGTYGEVHHSLHCMQEEFCWVCWDDGKLKWRTSKGNLSSSHHYRKKYNHKRHLTLTADKFQKSEVKLQQRPLESPRRFDTPDDSFFMSSELWKFRLVSTLRFLHCRTSQVPSQRRFPPT
jgi:hypothetical protein